MTSIWAKLLVIGTAIAVIIVTTLMAIGPGRIYSAKYYGVVTDWPDDYSFQSRFPLPHLKHRIDMLLDRKALTTTHMMSSTFWVELTDCRHRELGVSHVFVNGQSIFQVSDDMYRNLRDANVGDTLNASIYLSDEDFRSAEQLCLAARGGSMTGYGFRGNTVSVSR